MRKELLRMGFHRNTVAENSSAINNKMVNICLVGLFFIELLLLRLVEITIARLLRNRAQKINGTVIKHGTGEERSV